MTGVSLLVTVLATALVGISAGSNCSPIDFNNVSITPCSYDELEITQMWNQTVQLPDGYFLKLVDRNGTLTPCVYHNRLRKFYNIRTKFNTSFTPQVIASVEESPVCSPEKRLDCLQSTHVHYLGTDYFGISVWDEKNSSAQYLIVDSYGHIRFSMNLANTSFNLENMWNKNVFNCEDQHPHNQPAEPPLGDVISVTILILSVMIVLCVTSTVCILLSAMYECRGMKAYNCKRDER